MSDICLECGYSVTEPICASCILNEIKIWMYEQNIKKKIIKRINKEFKDLLLKIESLDCVLLPSPNFWRLSIMQCNICKKDMHIICSYCVINQASQIMKENLKDKLSIENFNESFNIALYDYELNNKLSSINTLKKGIL